MIYCNNLACEYMDEPLRPISHPRSVLQRVSDYRILTMDDGTQVYLCVGCYEDQPCFDGACDCEDGVGTPDQYEAQAVLRGEG
jgi:hypothetical protein